MENLELFVILGFVAIVFVGMLYQMGVHTEVRSEINEVSTPLSDSQWGELVIYNQAGTVKNVFQGPVGSLKTKAWAAVGNTNAPETFKLVQDNARGYRIQRTIYSARGVKESRKTGTYLISPAPRPVQFTTPAPVKSDIGAELRRLERQLIGGKYAMSITGKDGKTRHSEFPSRAAMMESLYRRVHNTIEVSGTVGSCVINTETTHGNPQTILIEWLG